MTRITVSIALALSLSACRFESPSVEEQQYLAGQGAFAGGAPAWASTNIIGKRASGLVPQTFDAPDAIRGRLSSEMLEADRQKKSLEEAKAKSEAKSVPVKSSPLDRISQACPGVESAVNEALTTLDLTERTAKYVSLTTQCSTSSDLWTWLGNDYVKGGKLAEAKRAYDQALVLAPGDPDATTGLNNVSKLIQKATPEGGQVVTPQP